MEKLAAKDKASQALLKDVYPAMLDLGRVKSIPGQYMLPWALDVLVMYYNKTLFQQAGVEFPKPTWTVDDMITAAKRLTKEGDSPPSPSTASPSPGPPGPVRALDARLRRDLVSEDGKKQMIDSPGSIEGIDTMAGLVTRHKVAPPIGTDFGGNAFQLGKAAIMFAIRNATVAIRRNVGARLRLGRRAAPGASQEAGHRHGHRRQRRLHPDQARRTTPGAWPSYMITPAGPEDLRRQLRQRPRPALHA